MTSSRPARVTPSRRGDVGAETERDSHLTSIECARRIAALCEEKSAHDVQILDMRGVCAYTDFFVIATGQNPRQTKGITDEVLAVLKADHRLSHRAVAGLPEATWIVVDYLDVVLHTFTPETRAYYRLEELWDDVPKLALAETI